jgi:hypothetical protein
VTWEGREGIKGENRVESVTDEGRVNEQRSAGSSVGLQRLSGSLGRCLE